jgi:hypothetical protein
MSYIRIKFIMNTSEYCYGFVRNKKIKILME